jgi:hypothetical protein
VKLLALLLATAGCANLLGLEEKSYVQGDAGGVDTDIDAPPDAIVRITDGLIARYDFNEGTGTTVADSSGFGTPLDLTIAGPVTWLTGALRTDGDVLIASPGAATKIYDAVVASGELTAEVWFTPSNLTQAGPARIVSLSLDTSERNFQLAQAAAQFNSRFRSSTTLANGQDTSAGTMTVALTHYVLTRTSTGTIKMYVNGSEISSTTPGGDLTTWVSTYALAVANEHTRDRDWLGELHLIALYSRALPVAEVMQNFNAGAASP